MGENDRKEEEKSFTVRDRRFTAQKETTEESKPQKQEEKKEEFSKGTARGPETPLPEMNFTNFLLSLSTSALMQLGEVPDPHTKETARQLPLAKQTIDLISMLQGKTKGNLTSDEAKLIEYILYDLRMRYVKAAG